MTRDRLRRHRRAGVCPLILLVNARVPANNLAELLALMRAQPGRLNMATTGVGGPVHIAAEILRTPAGVQMEMVHYRGGVLRPRSRW